jgi:hypothetical protein
MAKKNQSKSVKKETMQTIQKIYGTTSPIDVKLKIIWLHIQALMNAH